MEHTDGFGRGSDRTRGIITGMSEILKGPERPKKSWGCNELKKELNKVQMSSGDRMEAHQTEERTARLTGVTDADSGRVLRGKEGCRVPSRAKMGL